MYFLKYLKTLYFSYIISYLESGPSTGVQEDFGVKKELPEIGVDVDNILNKFENEDFKKQVNEEYGELVNKYEQNKLNLTIDRKEFLDDVKALETIRNNFSNIGIKGYKEFVDTLFSQSEGGKEYLYKLFLNNIDITKKIIQENGFPVNDKTLSIFLGKYKAIKKQKDIDLKEKDIDLKEKEIIDVKELNNGKEELNIKREELIKLYNDKVKDNEKLKGKNSSFDGLLDLMGEEEINGKEIVIYLKENFVEIAEFLRSQKGGEKIYRQFSSMAKGMGDGELQALVLNYENESLNEGKLGGNEIDVITLGSLPEGEIEGEGDVVFGIDDDGSKVRLDMSEIPPVRTISLEGSDYKMETDVPVGKDNYEALLEFEQKSSKLSRSIKTLDGIINYIKSLKPDTDIGKATEELKKNIPYTLRSQLGINLDNISSIDDLKNGINILERKKADYEKELEEAEKEYENKIEGLIEDYREIMKERDEKQKETLKFLHNIGFDLISQSTSNEIIRMLNSNGPLRKSIGFDNDEINLAEGNLGFNRDNGAEGNEDGDKKAFAEFTNIIISGEKDRPIDISSMTRGIAIFRDENGKEIMDKQAYVNKIMGVTPTETGMRHIGDFANNELKKKDEEK